MALSKAKHAKYKIDIDITLGLGKLMGLCFHFSRHYFVFKKANADHESMIE